jgi:hypothetical protein
MAKPPVADKAEGTYGRIIHAGEILPWGWSMQAIWPGLYRIVTPPNPNGDTKDQREKGVVVPLVDHPFVGTPPEQAAFAELAAWRAKHPRCKRRSRQSAPIKLLSRQMPSSRGFDV